MTLLHRATITSLLLVSVTFAGCRTAPVIVAAVSKLPTADPAELWTEPTDLEQRDLLAGPGGLEGAPNPDDKFEFISKSDVGYSPKWDVKDAKGHKWSVKAGLEAQPEIAVSRLAWAIGFHQPP